LVSARDGAVRLGVLAATQSQLTQIEGWVANFGKTTAVVEIAPEIGPKIKTENENERFDLFLAVIAPNPAPETTLPSLVARAGDTPCILLASQDTNGLDDGANNGALMEAALLDAALLAGAADYLPMSGMDAAQLERAVRFGMRRRQVVEQLKARENALAVAQERERQAVADALHDGPLQDLIGARFLLGALGPEVPTADVQESLQQVSKAVRALCSELKPPALGPFGLEKAIRAHMQTLQTRNPEIAVTLELDGELDGDQQQLPEWARVALFRIFQAAVQNVVQHSRASHLWVRLRLDSDEVRLTIADDGNGFELPANWLDFAQTEGFGLLMMQQRTDALHGRLMVQSSPGGGTRVGVQAPLDQPQRPLPAYLLYAAPERNG
jgi:signal transduction histidine kinase